MALDDQVSRTLGLAETEREIHILRVPTHELSQRSDGTRWCFYCRKRVEFTLTVSAPDDPMSHYGPHASIKCDRGHLDGDCFPGTQREWADGV